ncbi:MAG: YibE/F family protein [Solirubrobacterales bacterium]|nr:YibE/F family protein [Solirubrobacterales bacterium]
MAIEDLVDPAEYFAESDRRARERRSRRAPREAEQLAQTAAGRLLIALVSAIALFTVVGLLVLWPGAVHHRGPSQEFGGATRAAKVQRTVDARCPGPTPQTCRKLIVGIDGRSVPITLGPVRTVPSVVAGDTIRVSKTKLQPGVKAPPGFEPYQFVDLDRQGSILLVGLVLAALAVVLLRWRGLLAAVGVALSILLLTTFVVPALLDGKPALLVALVGSLAVMFVTLVLTNGIGAQTLAAALGITATLLLVGVLAAIFVPLAHLDEHGTDVASVLTLQNGSISLRGVVLAGMVIGGLGVLADTGVTQASAVMALRRANPRLGTRGLYRGAIVVGRDHLSATIHTLVLAYAGASLPLLLAARSTGLGFSDALNSQNIAEPVIATIIGCVGLVAALPLTTGLASALASRLPAGVVPAGHGHSH